MPHIPDSDRDEAVDAPRSASELTYAISAVISEYVSYKGISRATLVDVVGATETAKLEFYRQVVGDFEDGQQAANGSVFPEVV